MNSMDDIMSALEENEGQPLANPKEDFALWQETLEMILFGQLLACNSFGSGWAYSYHQLN